MPYRTTINGQCAVPVVLGYMGCCIAASQGTDKVRCVIVLVGTYGDPAQTRDLLDHVDRRIPLRSSRCFRHSRVHDKTVAVLHKGMPHVTELRFLSLALSVQSGVGIGGRGVRVIRECLPVEVYRIVSA